MCGRSAKTHHLAALLYLLSKTGRDFFWKFESWDLFCFGWFCTILESFSGHLGLFWGSLAIFFGKGAYLVCRYSLFHRSYCVRMFGRSMSMSNIMQMFAKLCEIMPKITKKKVIQSALVRCKTRYGKCWAVSFSDFLRFYKISRWPLNGFSIVLTVLDKSPSPAGLFIDGHG